MLRMTNQREVIIEELKRLNSHPTADELYEIVRKRLPHISLATVYRNLEQLSEAGIIKKLEYPGRQKRFDGNTSEHSHIKCIKCGRIADVAVKPRSDLKDMIDDAMGFKVLEAKIDFTGLCPECQRGMQLEGLRG